MKKSLVIVGLVSVIVSGCATSDKYERGMAEAKKPINCHTAQADIRMLQSEKMHTNEQIAAGVTSIIPASLVLGLVTGKAGDKVEIATGDYNDALDERISEIKALCPDSQ